MDAYSSKEKKKKRPIAHGVVSITDAMRFVYLTGILAFATSLLLNRIVFFISIIYFIILFLYSYPGVRFKNKFIIKNAVTAIGPPLLILIGGAAVEASLSTIFLLLSTSNFFLFFLILPAGADCLDIEEDRAFNVKTIGGALTWRQNLLLFNLAVLTMVSTSVISYKLFNMSYLAPLLMAGIGIPLILFTFTISNLDNIRGVDKLRPVAYVFLLLAPLILTLGAVF
jgi:4-hydroxybenzoate polyprenyltransferase